MHHTDVKEENYEGEVLLCVPTGNDTHHLEQTPLTRWHTEEGFSGNDTGEWRSPERGTWKIGHWIW